MKHEMRIASAALCEGREVSEPGSNLTGGRTRLQIRSRRKKNSVKWKQLFLYLTPYSKFSSLCNITT